MTATPEEIVVKIPAFVSGFVLYRTAEGDASASILDRNRGVVASLVLPTGTDMRCGDGTLRWVPIPLDATHIRFAGPVTIKWRHMKPGQ